MTLLDNPVVAGTLIAWWILLMYMLMLRCKESPHILPCHYSMPSAANTTRVHAKQQYQQKADLGHACKEAYKTTIDPKLRVRFVAGKSVMMDHHSIQEMCELLGDGRDKDVLEWGSGGSTLFFSQFARTWVAFEHDVRFGDAIHRYVQEHGMLHSEDGGGNVYIDSVPNLPDLRNINEKAGLFPERYRPYTDGPEILYPGRKYDIILDDGVAREECAESVLRNQLLKPGGVLVIHDFERKAYHVVLNRGWKLVRLIKEDRRHLAVLQPK